MKKHFPAHSIKSRLIISVAALAMAFACLIANASFSPGIAQMPMTKEQIQQNKTDNFSFLDRLAALKREREMQPGRRYALEVREWLNEPKPPLATFLFSALVSALALAFFPGAIETATRHCKKHYWRCFGRALLTNICLFLLFRVSIESKITTPLALLFAGVLELFIAAGLALGIIMMGESLLAKLAPNFLQDRPRARKTLIILLGSLFATLIIQIPGLGRLPRPGSRLMLLLATLGEGGLLALLQNKNKENQSSS